jgi:hypothetical protein
MARIEEPAAEVLDRHESLNFIACFLPLAIGPIAQCHVGVLARPALGALWGILECPKCPNRRSDNLLGGAATYESFCNFVAQAGARHEACPTLPQGRAGATSRPVDAIKALARLPDGPPEDALSFAGLTVIAQAGPVAIAMLRDHYASAAQPATFDDYAGTPIRSRGSGKSGCRDGIA